MNPAFRLIPILNPAVLHRNTSIQKLPATASKPHGALLNRLLQTNHLASHLPDAQVVSTLLQNEYPMHQSPTAIQIRSDHATRFSCGPTKLVDRFQLRPPFPTNPDGQTVDRTRTA